MADIGITVEQARAVLDCPMEPGNAAGTATVRQYLTKLLEELWREEEGFSGKRPFGSSGWQSDVHLELVRHGMVAGTLDADGYLDDCDDDTADALVLAAIAELGRTPAAGPLTYMLQARRPGWDDRLADAWVNWWKSPVPLDDPAQALADARRDSDREYRLLAYGPPEEVS